jgi:hypothetical protein
MTRPLHCSLFALLAATLGLLGSCSGTETDNPVAGNDNPVIDGPSNEPAPPMAAPPCAAPFPSSGPNFPSGLAQTLLLPEPNPHVLATGQYSGLDLVDISDPAHPMTLSSDVVPGTIQQLLLSTSGKLWVAATEPPAFPDGGLPAPPELDAAVHIVELDVTDPRAPFVVAETKVDGTFWQMQERGDSIWALTARLVAAQRDCSYVQNFCAGPSYEAVVLRGFQVDASELTPITEAELPFDLRAFWRPDGVVTSLSDGSLHLLTWDAQGSLRAPLELALGDAQHRPGPIDVVGNQLSVVDTSGDRRTLRIYDLEAGLDTPQRSADLGPSADALSEFSLFDSGKLWLSNGYVEDFSQGLDYSGDAAQLWDVSGDTPQRVDLTQAFSYLVPVTGATLDSDPAALLAVGWQGATGETPSIIALSAGNLSVLAPPDGAQALQLNAGASTAAPAGVSGMGSSDSWQLVLRGAGLPLGIDPPVPAPPPTNVSLPFAFVEVPLSGAQTAEAQLREDSASARTLQITTSSSTVSFDVAPNATELIATPDAVIVVAEKATSSCPQPSIGCGTNAPGIAVYDLSGQPRLAGSAEFPSPPIPSSDHAFGNSPTWSLVRGLGEGSATPLAAAPLTLVADIDLVCGDQQTCAALGVDIPAGVNAPALPETCTPNPNSGSCEILARPAVAESRREYFFALSLDAALQPSWQPIGISTGESTSAMPGKASKFGNTLVAGNVIGVTRFEPLSSSGEALPGGQARFMFDRFARSASGDGIVYPPTNVIGQPIARFPDSGSAQLWLSVDAPAAAFQTASANGTGMAHLLYIDQQGAHDAQSLPLAGAFADALTLQSDDGSSVPVVLTTPANSCGSSRLTAFRLARGGALQGSTLELPEDRWSIVAVDGPRVALQRDQAYALVELGGNALSVHSLRSSDGDAQDLQLRGTTLFSIGNDAFRIEF